MLERGICVSGFPAIGAGMIVGSPPAGRAASADKPKGAFTTSAAMMRPPGPVPFPVNPANERPRASAILRASGEALILSEEAVPILAGMAKRERPAKISEVVGAVAAAEAVALAGP